MIFKSKRKKKICIILTSIILGLALIITPCAIYLGDYYYADKTAIQAFNATIENKVEMQTLQDDTLIFAPDESTAGFIFYPGGKVEHEAYIPLMQALAAKGIFCALLEMPFHLAILDIDGADGIREKYPQIQTWYLGGHSLGGVAAASYLAKHEEDFAGLVLLGSYSTEDFSETKLNILSIYGSEDKVLNREKYEENKPNLPTDFTEVVLEGGCHAYFGMYGAQDGDGTPTMTNEEQIRVTAATIAEHIQR